MIVNYVLRHTSFGPDKNDVGIEKLLGNRVSLIGLEAASS